MAQRSLKGLVSDKRVQAAVMVLIAAIASYFGLVAQ